MTFIYISKTKRNNRKPFK